MSSSDLHIAAVAPSQLSSQLSSHASDVSPVFSRSRSDAEPLLAVYLFCEPLVADKAVLDLGPRLTQERAGLRRGAARDVTLADTRRPELQAADASVDVVLCLSVPPAAQDPDFDRRRWLSEIKRVLRPDGFCLLRFASDEDEGWQPLLAASFAFADVVTETPLRAVSFSVPGVEDVAVNEALAVITGDPSHRLYFCSPDGPGPWQLAESLLVPLGTGTLPEPGFCLDCERLHQHSLVLEDRIDRSEETLSALHRATERHLAQIADEAAAAELALLERDKERRRTGSAERALETVTAEVRTLRVALAAAEMELARLRRP
jgi:SAM-dependent methyltransferase